jgi:pimeloyl-ACP methyl ester carboxylesterase
VRAGLDGRCVPRIASPPTFNAGASVGRADGRALSRQVSVVYRRPIAAVMPNASVAILGGQGHAALMTAPGLVAAEVARFLAE